ncbi:MULTISPECIES: cell wall protein [Nocardiopsidaceae]|uniref:Cell wall protein n=1 Tax=Streptomonospora nanhaiensis TaxID=1323731 RepID=A0ABY6YNQ3_9ACTN|nr:cell wall protein [Streptomonospora nanhaiensis]WAE73960.1 cell wall protein [Streptomonospora nanhaiensis]
MKNTRVTARRILQGGAAFAALGALGVATALPAAADTQTVGWAHANVADGYGIAETYITPQGESNSDSSGFSGALDEYFSIEASTSASVDGNGATATTTVASATIRLTASDVEEIIAGAEDEEADDEESDADDDPTATPSEEPGDDESTAPGEGEGDGDAGTPPAEPTDPPAETPEAPEVPEVPETPAADGGEVSGEEAAAPLVELDADDIELSSADDEIVLSATISGASVTTTQAWDGSVSHSVVPGAVSYEVNELDAVVGDPYQDQGTYTSDDAGFDWDDAYTALLVDISVPGQPEVGTYALGVTYASVGVTADDAGNGGGDGDGGSGDGGGDDKNPPSRDAEDQPKPKPEPKPTEALATTGSPLAGLIAAGAAIAAGGGAAAYFARRRKSAADSAAESSEG